MAAFKLALVLFFLSNVPFFISLLPHSILHPHSCPVFLVGHDFIHSLLRTLAYIMIHVLFLVFHGGVFSSVALFVLLIPPSYLLD